jgi:hypothetical protein
MILFTANNPNLSFSPYTHKYLPHILHRYLNTFRVFSMYEERMKNTQKEIFPFNNAPEHYRDSVSKNSYGGLYACVG